MGKIKLQYSEYTQEEVTRYEADGWTWRKSGLARYPNTGLWYKYVYDECHKHGRTQHIKVMQESKMQKKYNLDGICRECARENERRALNPNIDYKRSSNNKSHRFKR